MDAGIDMIALGRPLIHDPDFILKLRSGKITETECDRCNKCIVEMDREGVRCVK
jgi:2,4-dienoyl-CoA reductase-like NADH-dependent reductase (Old Yellow Enzyme family)